MSRIVIIAGFSKSLVGFRGDLIKRWVALGYEVYAIAPENDCRCQIMDLGVKEFYNLELSRTGNNPMADFGYVIRLRKLLKKIKPDITLGYTIKPAVYGAIAAKMAGVGNINSMITGAGFLFASDSLKAKILKKLSFLLLKTGFSCADHVIFQNKDDLNEFVAEGLVKKGKCHLVNGSGVNMERFKPVQQPEKMTFLMMARLLYAKGTLEFFNAAQIIKEKFPNTRFIVIGEIDNKADSLKEEDVIPFFSTGIIEQVKFTNNVPEFLGQCSVYVLPSYREGTPRSVLEAMAMARPIITTDTPGCRETVIDGVNGFLIPVKNVDALVEKMEWFIVNRDKIQEMGDMSYRICTDKFEVSKINESMNKIMGLTNV